VPRLDWGKNEHPMKIFVILVGAFLCLHLAPFVVAIVAILGGLAIPLGVLYGIYRLIWWLVVGKRASAGYHARWAGVPAGGPRHRSRRGLPRRNKPPNVACTKRPLQP